MKRFFEKYLGYNPSTMKVSTEILAGITIFLSMAYILALNPGTLSTTGMDKGALFTITALSIVVGTLVMAFVGRLPFALGPGVGLSAFFAFAVCGTMGYDWRFALTAVLIEGVIFLILAATNLWKYLVDAIPDSLKKATGAGIGLFIAFIGLKNGGVIVDHSATFVTLGDLTHGPALLSMIGLVITSLLVVFKVPGNLLLGIIITAIVGIPMGITNFTGAVDVPPSAEPIFCHFVKDWHQIFSIDMLVIVFTFLFVDMFDTIGTLVGVATKAKLTDNNGRLRRMNQAFLSDAIATISGAIMGTSTVTTFVESATGVAQGGRSGLTAFVTAICFAIAMFFAPIFLAIPPSALCPVLVLVGLYMLSPIQDINLDDFSESIPAYLCVILMPLTFNISTGILIGLISYVIINLVLGNFKKMTPLMYVLAVLFVLKFIFLR